MDIGGQMVHALKALRSYYKYHVALSKQMIITMSIDYVHVGLIYEVSISWFASYIYMYM